MMVYWYWEAMLISYLATRVISLPFRDIQGLVESSDYRIAAIPDSTLEMDFKFAKDVTWQRAYRERLRPHLEEYRGALEDRIKYASEESSTALYDNYFSIMFLTIIAVSRLKITINLFLDPLTSTRIVLSSPFLESIILSRLDMVTRRIHLWLESSTITWPT